MRATFEYIKTRPYEGVSKSFGTGRLERELQMVQLSATRCSCMAILWVSLVSFVAITLCVASQWVFIVVSVYFVIDPVRKLLDTPSYTFYLVWKSCHCRQPQMVRLSATRCSCMTILWVSLVSFVAVILCVASQWVFIVVYFVTVYEDPTSLRTNCTDIHFVTDSVRKLLDAASY
jgi:sterol desaturase/sphingolipid hydroxylase (fatty acid hydroxylase superfamily)